MSLKRIALTAFAGAALTAGALVGAAAPAAATPVPGWETIDSYPTHAECDQGAIDHGVADNYRCVFFEGVWDLNVPA
jgi:hypothetical protein